MKRREKGNTWVDDIKNNEQKVVQEKQKVKLN